MTTNFTRKLTSRQQRPSATAPRWRKQGLRSPVHKTFYRVN